MVREHWIKRYAELLVDYSLDVKPGDKVLVQTTPLAEDLVMHLSRCVWQRGGWIETLYQPQGHAEWMYLEGVEATLDQVSPFKKLAFETFDAYLYIRAPYNLRSTQNLPRDQVQRHREAQKEIMETYQRRTADGSLRRSLCQYPTPASAQVAGMSLREYEDFVFGACRLYDEDPIASWQAVGRMQQTIVDHLNTVSQVTYKGPHTDLSFDVGGRTWVNSDGKTNMPSGEVFSAPIEDSAQGHIHFDYPAIFRGHEIQGITLTFDKGEVVKAHADKGNEFLQEILKMKGANRLGEVAIGTNDRIQQATGNILFDEKIGGSVHLALGQAYIQCGGLNQSPIHWDMVSDMSQGEIWADGQKIYENGKFLPFLLTN